MKHLICLLMSFISLGLHSQNVITYRYDASGNRISRLYKSNANSQKNKKIPLHNRKTANLLRQFSSGMAMRR